MNILLLGAGGREHALAWQIARSRRINKLYIAPGNAGTGQLGQNINIASDDFLNLGDFAVEKNIDMVVVGPEDPLVKGIFDFFRDRPQLKNVSVIGPSMNGARLEGSKEFAKEFMMRHGIPTAKYFGVNEKNLQEGITFLGTLKPPFVLKADGLAAGKGVLIINSFEEAKKELQSMIAGKFGSASKSVVIEEYLKGIELSAFVITDGISYRILPEAKDYKRIGEGDTGLNTGGMGCISPVPFADKEFRKKVEERIIKPTIKGIHDEGLEYCGFLFFGLIKCGEDPYVIEYNVRLGDPETEVILPRIKSDILLMFKAVADKRLDTFYPEIDPDSCAAVMLVSGGYPGDYEKGKIITNMENIADSMLFHAGTQLHHGEIITSGGRVMAVSSMAKNFRDALKLSYKNAEIINFDGKYFRRDIGFDL